MASEITSNDSDTRWSWGDQFFKYCQPNSHRCFAYTDIRVLVAINASPTQTNISKFHLPSLKLTAKAPEKWGLGDDPLLLGQKAYFQGRTLSSREGKQYIYIYIYTDIDKGRIICPIKICTPWNQHKSPSKMDWGFQVGNLLKTWGGLHGWVWGKPWGKRHEPNPQKTVGWVNWMFIIYWFYMDKMPNPILISIYHSFFFCLTFSFWWKEKKIRKIGRLVPTGNQWVICGILILCSIPTTRTRIGSCPHLTQVFWRTSGPEWPHSFANHCANLSFESCLIPSWKALLKMIFLFP